MLVGRDAAGCTQPAQAAATMLVVCQHWTEWEGQEHGMGTNSKSPEHFVSTKTRLRGLVVDPWAGTGSLSSQHTNSTQAQLTFSVSPEQLPVCLQGWRGCFTREQRPVKGLFSTRSPPSPPGTSTSRAEIKAVFQLESKRWPQGLEWTKGACSYGCPPLSIPESWQSET